MWGCHDDFWSWLSVPSARCDCRASNISVRGSGLACKWQPTSVVVFCFFHDSFVYVSISPEPSGANPTCGVVNGKYFAVHHDQVAVFNVGQLAGLHE